MDSARDTLSGGLPHSEIPGSQSARLSPGLFAACHVLHRLSVPRHPPDALLTLDPAKPVTPRDKPPNATRSLLEDTLPHWADCDGTLGRQLSAVGLERQGSRPGQHNFSLHPDKEQGRGIDAGCRAIRLFSIVLPRRLAESSQPTASLVEVNGIEPMTSCLQSRRSPN
jgi:hypothetical protein